MALGWPSVSWGLNQISAYELAEWQVFAKLEPFGAYWENILFAMLASVIANVNRDPKKKRKPFDLEDFMLLKDEGAENELPEKHSALQKLKEQMNR